MIALLDYGSGNIRSVTNALRRESADVELVDRAEDFADAEALILPGVGAFGDCVQGIRSRGLWAPIQNWLASGKPFLGICVGYQMLFESSEESPGVAGFGYFKGRVKRFSTVGLKVPQIGWNELDLVPHALWADLPSQPYVYYVHSFFPEPRDPSVVTSWSTYGERFAASAARDAVAGVQFHPEKSQEIGLAILRNFIRSVPAPAAANAL